MRRVVLWIFGIAPCGGYATYRLSSWTFDGFTMENFLGGIPYVLVGATTGCVLGLVIVAFGIGQGTSQHKADDSSHGDS